MPNKFKRPCNIPGCNNLTVNTYCDKHAKEKKKQVDKNRPTAAQRGYGSRWQKYRITFLRIHPLCAECERQNKTTAATVVDHIIPHKGDSKLFWDPNNHQPLCKQCHDIKTAKEDGGFGNG